MTRESISRTQFLRTHILITPHRLMRRIANFFGLRRSGPDTCSEAARESIRVEGATMTNQIHQSRRQTPVQSPASQDGTWGMHMSLLQRASQATRLFNRASLQQVSVKTGRYVAAFALALGIASPTFSEDQFPGDIDYTIPVNAHSIPDYSGSLNSQPTNGVGGFGMMGRAGHEAGDTVGREGSLSYFDLAPYTFHGDTMFFGDGRLFVTNRGKMGGSAGLGMRHFFPSKNTVLGSTFYYDHDESRGVTFEQFTIAGELLTEFFDIRTNVYIPFGKKQQVTAVRFEPGTQMFVDAVGPGGGVQGSNITFQSRTFSSSALEGFDTLLSTPIHGALAEKHNLEVSAGAYHYQARGLDLEKVTGFKLRMDGDFLDRLSHMFLEVTSDNVFNTNVVFGADVNYWGHLDPKPRLGKSQYSRMASWVRRSRTVSTLDNSALNAPELAINPDDGDPYLIYHVRNNPNPPPGNFPAPLGNGSLSMPFQYIQEAIDESPFADIVFVQANSVFDGVVDGNGNATAVLRDNVLVLGEGVPLTIPVVGIVNEIDLPTVTPGPASRPIIQNVTGPVITMGNNSRFAGFTIQDYADGPAILASGIDSAELNELIINNSTGPLGSGIEIDSSTGGFVLENISISNTSGNAFSVTGGNATVVFNGENTITNSSGLSVLIEDAGGSVNMRNTTIMDDGGEGILVRGTTATSSKANVTFDQIELLNTNTGRSGAFQVENHSAGVTVANAMTIDTPLTGGISVLNLQSTGSVVFQGAVTVTDRNDHGLLVQDIAEGPDPFNPGANRAGLVTFQDTLTINGLGATPSATAAIEVQSSSGTITLNNVAIDTSLAQGIDIQGILDTGTTIGRFVVVGQTSIRNVLGNSINIENIQKSMYQIVFTDVDINNRGTVGIDVDTSSAFTQFLGSVLIDNQLGTTAPAIVINQNSGDIGFNLVSVQNALGALSTDSGVLITDNTNADPNEVADVSFTRLNVEFFGNAAVDDDTAVRINGNDNVQVSTGVLEATDAAAIRVFDNVRHNLMFESITASNDRFGIFVGNSPGSFIVTGVGQNAGSGGEISQMTVDGAHFNDTQYVDLGYMDFLGNNLAIHGQTIIVEGAGLDPEVFLRGLDIRNSDREAIFMDNVSDFTLMDSTLVNNGTAANQQQIDFLATIDEIDIDGDGVDDDPDDLVVYNVNIVNNSIMDGQTTLAGTDMISLRTGGAIGKGAPLNFALLNNGIPGGMTFAGLTPNRANGAAVDVTWTGQSQIAMDSNTILFANGPNNQTGVELNIDGIADVLYSNNDLASSGINDIGLDFTFLESTNLIISNNLRRDADNNVIAGSGFQMTGNGATGMSLTFQSGGNNIAIENNQINLAGFDSTGIAFERIFAASNVAINGNGIFMVTDFDNAREEGIIFRDVRGVINLNGNVNNVIPLGSFFPFYLDFFIPAGTSNGQIIVNGNAVP